MSIAIRSHWSADCIDVYGHWKARAYNVKSGDTIVYNRKMARSPGEAIGWIVNELDDEDLLDCVTKVEIDKPDLPPGEMLRLHREKVVSEFGE